MPQFDSDFEKNLYAQRQEKLREIAALSPRLGLTDSQSTYPNSFLAFPDDIALTGDAIPHIKARFDDPAAPLSTEQLEQLRPSFAFAGRVMALRVQGKAGFAQLQQGGQRLQIYVRKDDIGATPDASEALFALYKLLDLGDIVGVRGSLMRTRTGELTLKLHPLSAPGQQGLPALQLLTKAMLALPDKYHGLEDVETRYRQRYVDLIMNSGTRPQQEQATPQPGAQPPAPATPTSVILSEGRSPQPKDPDTLSPATTAGPLPATSPVPPTQLGAPSSPTASPSAKVGSNPQPEAQPPASETPTPVILSEGRSPQPKDPDTLRPATTPSHLPAAPPVPATQPGAPSSPTAPPSTKMGSSPHPGADPLPPGASAVTDTAPPNEEHNDAPRNVREVFVKRAAILRSIRRFFDTRGFLEVETPMLQTIAGGAAARPFTTHHNALDIPLSLRIAPELYLKRLVVGGFDRVYEINRNFRNEGISTQHNPEFTMLEFYQAYANYHDLMDLTQELIIQVAQEVNGTAMTHFNGHEIDLSKWTKLSIREAILKFWPPGLEPTPTMEVFANPRAFYSWLDPLLQVSRSLPHADMDEAENEIARLHIRLVLMRASPTSNSVGKLIAELFEAVAEPHLIQPTIIYDFPLAVSPLSKPKPDEPDWVERFEFYIGGFEVGNAFSELNDPLDQERRFEAQLEQKARGDEEAMAEVDHDYVRALGYGLPPTAGEGIGIDRLTMLLTGSRSIRDVILFPLMRPHQKPTPPEPTSGPN